MATTGDLFPGTAVSVARASATAWTNPGNVKLDDAADSSVAVPTQYLVTGAYGFAVPLNATVLGVTVRVEASETGSGGSDFIPQLSSALTPTLIGSATAAVGVSGTTKAITASGGKADKWGAVLTPAIVNDAGFGATLWSTDTTNVLAVDFVTVAVEFTGRALASSGVG